MIKGDVPDMALILGSNEAIYESVRDDLSKPTVSVTRCRKRAVSFGRFQTAKAEVDVEKCRELGIEVVRRQDVCKDEDCGTVFHDHDCEVMCLMRCLLMCSRSSTEAWCLCSAPARLRLLRHRHKAPGLQSPCSQEGAHHSKSHLRLRKSSRLQAQDKD